MCTKKSKKLWDRSWDWARPPAGALTDFPSWEPLLALIQACPGHQAGPSPRGGSPQKGVNKEYNDLFPMFSQICWVLKLRFVAFSGGPGGFRELRKAYRINFHMYLGIVRVTRLKNLGNIYQKLAKAKQNLRKTKQMVSS